MIHKYVLHIGSDQSRHAGSKAMNDCDKILKNMGFKIVYVKQTTSNTFVNKIYLLKILFIKSESLLVIHHPYYIGMTYMRLLKFLKSIKKVRLVFLIHDIESLRCMFPDKRQLFVDLDNMMFSIADYIIAHNHKMIDYLTSKRQVNKEKMYNLNLFDYLIDFSNHSNKIGKDNGLVIAGNLDSKKSGYIYSLLPSNSKYFFNLYGVNFSASTKYDNFDYYGAFHPDKLPLIMNGKYGIVWDGDELVKCNGSVGEYLRYNNPHKVSLYIAAGIPIIIWKHAALADFIKNEGIGIIVDDLTDLEKYIDKISDEQYDAMKHNIVQFSSLVRSGYFLKSVMKELLSHES